MVWPVIQSFGYLNLTPISIEVDLKKALSKQNIRVDVPSSFTIAISTEPEVMRNAAERLFGLKKENIESLAKEQKIPLKKERFEMFEGYQSSSYMKKKWKSYLKKEKKKTPSFEEVMKVMIAYYRPIWDSLAEGNYYLGDWMPELMRYLD